MKTKHTIWSCNINLDDWADYIEELKADGRIDEDDDGYEECADLNAEYLDDERINLNIPIDDGIIVLADLGLWDGRRYAYYEHEFYNIADCLYSLTRGIVYPTWYVDRYNFKCNEMHHDGTNYYTYRKWKSGLSDTQKENFLDKVVMGTVTNKDISRYTESLRPYIAKVYGW